jgi:hypothetical protein
VGVPVVTVQLRYNGWVTELQDLEQSRWISIYADALIVKAGCFFQWPRISSAVVFFETIHGIFPISPCFFQLAGSCDKLLA